MQTQRFLKPLGLAFALAVTGCNGGSVTAPPTTLPPTSAPSPAASAGPSATVPIGSSSTVANLVLPSGAGKEAIAFPAVVGTVPAGATLKIAANTSAPAGAAPLSLRAVVALARRARPLSSTFTPVLFTTIDSGGIPIQFQAPPAVTYTLSSLIAGSTYAEFSCALPCSASSSWTPLGGSMTDGAGSLAFPTTPATFSVNGQLVIALVLVQTATLNLAPSALTLVPGAALPATFTASEAGSTGTPYTAAAPAGSGVSFVASSSAPCSGTPASSATADAGGSFYVCAASSAMTGSAVPISVADTPGSGQTQSTATETITIGNAPAAPASLVLSGTGVANGMLSIPQGTVASVTASETGFTGTLTANPAQQQGFIGVAQLSQPASNGAATFLIGGLSPGSTFVVFSDGRGNNVTLNVTVTGALSQYTTYFGPPAALSEALHGDTNHAVLSLNAAQGILAVTAYNASLPASGGPPAPPLTGGAALFDLISVATLTPTTLGSQVSFYLASSGYTNISEWFYVPAIPGISAPGIPGWIPNLAAGACTGSTNVSCTFDLSSTSQTPFGNVPIPAGTTFWIAITGTPPAMGGGTVTINPASVSFLGLSASPITIAASEPSYSGAFTATETDVTGGPGVVTVTPVSGSPTFVITPKSAGTATVTVSDMLMPAHTATIPVTVTTTAVVPMSKAR